MSEDRPPDDDGASVSGTDSPASGTDKADTADSPPDTPDARSERARWLRIARPAAFAIAGVGVVVALVVGVRSQRDPDGGASVAGDGGAQIQAPKPPALPGDPNSVRLSGSVVDGANAPVVGVEVSAELEKGVADRSLSTTPVGVDAGVGSGAPTVSTAPATGADGRFVLEGLAAGRYRLRVTGPGVLPAEVRYVPVPSDEARIVISRLVVVEGSVLDGGAPIVNASVGLRGEAIGGAIETKTDPKGAFKFPDLPEGRYQIYAWRDTLAARAVRLNRLGAGPFPAVQLSLEAATIVVGRVIDKDEGVGLPAAVELRPSGDDQAPRYARTNPDGSFRIEGVPHGRWIADAFSPGYTSPGGVEVEAGRGISELALARGATIEGRVLDGDGNPVANASVRALGAATGSGAERAMIEQSAAVDQDRLRRFTGRIAAPAPIATLGTAADPMLLPRGELGVMVGPIPPIPPPGAQVARPAAIDSTAVTAFVGEPAPLEIDAARASIWTTGPDGRYRIRGLPRGKLAVLALASGYAESSSPPVTVGVGQVVTNVDVVLTPGTYLTGRVADQHGARVVGAQVRAKPQVGAPIDAFTDEDGAYKLGPFAGSVELTASAYGHGETQHVLELAPVSGKTPAERKQDLVLAVADAVVAGTLDDTGGAPVAGAHVEIISGGGEGRQTVVAADGTFAIDMLPAGPVRLRITHAEYPAIELDATAAARGAKVRLRMPLGGAVEGALLDDNTGAPLAGVVIAALGPNGATADTTSDDKGRWKLGPLRPGRWKLTIDQPGYLPAKREVEVSASRSPGATSVHDVRFDLVRGAVVGGTVRDARGQRVADASVTVQAASGDGPTAVGSTDTQGEFRIRDVPTGEVLVTVTSATTRGSARVTLRAGDEVLGLAIEVR